MRRYQEGVTDADIERAFGDAEDECEIDDWELEVAIDEAIECRFLPGAIEVTTPMLRTPRALSGGGQCGNDTQREDAPATPLPGASASTTPNGETPRAPSGGGHPPHDTQRFHAPATPSSHNPGGAND